jgi:hypothetical protein
MILELVRRRTRQLSNDTPLGIEVESFSIFCTINSSCFLGVLTLFFNDRHIAAERNLGVVFEVMCGDEYSKRLRGYLSGKQRGNREK